MMPNMRDRFRTLPRRLLSPFAAGKARERLGRESKLHLGCGDNILEGWANIDLSGPSEVIAHDLTAALPVADGTIGFIYSEHFIEHIPLVDAERLLAECHRILRPGGVLRLSTPDLAKLVSEYTQQRTSEWGDVDWNPATPCRMLNEGMRLWGHAFVYDWPELEALLKRAGFDKIARVRWRESTYPDLTGLECRSFHDELIVEATR